MLDFQQIREQYPANLQKFERAILREYLQYKILQAVFDCNYASKLAFLGGTALRIVYRNNRFSEDIDLDNFGLSWTEFEEVIQKVKRFMALEGFEVEIRNVDKDAYRCYLKFPALLYEQGLSPFQEEKILIQLDTTAQGYPYKPEIILINKFDVFADNVMRHAVIGVELLLGENFHIDMGYNYRRRMEMKMDKLPGMVGFSWGFGLRVSKFHVAYGRSSYHLAGGTSHFSLTTNLSEFYKSN